MKQIMYFMAGVLLAAGTPVTAQESVLITQVGCVDVETGRIRTRDVFLDGGQIREVSRRYRGPEADRVLDGTGQYLLPGLIDAHIHLFQSGGIYTRPDAIDLREFRPYETEIRQTRKDAYTQLQRYLAAGITTVLDMGGPMYHYTLRDTRPDSLPGAELWLTGPLISTYVPPALQVEDPPIIKAEGPEDARRLVREQVPQKPDFIKIWYVLAGAEGPEATYDLVAAAIDESHKNGLPVAVHATQLETAKLAVQAGADILVHSVDDPVDDAFIRQLLESNVVYVPTLVVHGHYIDSFTLANSFSEADFRLADPFVLGSLMDGHHLPPGNPLERFEAYKTQLEEAAEQQDRTRAENLKRLAGAGIVIATGTDAGNIGTLHASSYFKELAWMREAGMSNGEILKASTLNAAAALGRDARVGSIEEGKEADLLLLPQNPLEDLQALRRPGYVIADGAVYTPGELLPSGPEVLVQQQLNAYNAGQTDAFMAPYHEEVELYYYPNELFSEGKAAMRPVYERLFQQVPDLHCELVNRMVLGNKVIDYERLTGFPDGRTVEAIALYEIAEGKIKRVTFLYPE